eukprot:GHVR01177448.1.p1 GENE.GHVR01177448.1~~GHVR01177448.1.p1  ORF type:complete len:219 (+),score=93.18 GHVR01177448.1:56-658(+)
MYMCVCVRLEQSLRHFATLTVGDSVVIRHGKKSYEIEVVEVRPANAVSIIETDVEVDFSPPKDYVEPTRLPPSGVSSSSIAPGGSIPSTPQHTQTTHTAAPVPVSVFSGAGKRLDGKTVKSVSDTHTHTQGGGEEDDKPWTSSRRLKGGVRTFDLGFDQMVAEGRVPGYLGKKRRDNTQHTQQNESSGGGLFGGPGHSLR